MEVDEMDQCSERLDRSFVELNAAIQNVYELHCLVRPPRRHDGGSGILQNENGVLELRVIVDDEYPQCVEHRPRTIRGARSQSTLGAFSKCPAELHLLPNFDLDEKISTRVPLRLGRRSVCSHRQR
jgi:hypothetical protein